MRMSLTRVANSDAHTLASQKRSLLEAGDIDGLFALNRSIFGQTRMGPDDEDDGDEDDGDSGDEDDDSEDSDDEDDEDGDGGDGDEDADQDSKKETPTQKRLRELSAENKRYRLEKSKRGRRIKELEAELSKLKKGSKGKDDSEDSEDSSDALAAERAKLEKDRENFKVELEFMGNTKYQWKNPKAALKLLDRSEIEVVDGTVEGLEDALDALAKDEPYLLAEKAPAKKRQRNGSTGQPSGQQKRKGNPDREKLLNKYPALRR